MNYFDGAFGTLYGKLTWNGEAVEFINSPNQSKGIDPKYLILHYTASPSMQSSINWFRNPSAKASAQFIIDYDGTIVQMVPLNRKAWHAGRSTYRGINGLNSHSIGIELVNPGHLEPIGDGRYRSWFKKVFDDNSILTARSGEQYPVDLIEARHPIMGGGVKGWVLATEPQIEATIMLGSYLMDKYNMKDVLPHEVISKGRKWDTGPTLPQSVYDRIGSRDDDVVSNEKDVAEVRVNTYLNMRAGPGSNYDRIARIKNGEMVEITERHGPWRKISTFNDSMVGWVHGNFLVE